MTAFLAVLPYAVMSDESSDPLVGQTLQDRYEVKQRLAAGAMGVVYRGEHVGLGRTVAIKFLHPMFAAEPTFKERFEREALTMSRLDHPNCVSVIDVGVDQAPYIVMDFVQGVTLDRIIDDEPLPPARAIDIVRQVLAGLAHAHKHGIVHRDIKAANVMLAEATGKGDHVRILDFGLAKFRGGTDATLTGVVVGTPAYMSPEQAAGEKLDARSDIYSCGVLLFQLLTGEKPFTSEETFGLLRKHLEEPPPKLRDRCPEVPFSEQLEEAVAWALAKAREDRPQSAQDLADVLAGVPELTGDAAAVVPIRRPRATPSNKRVVAAPTIATGPGKSRPSRKIAWGKWAVLAVLLAVGAVLLFTQTGRKVVRDTKERAHNAVFGSQDAGASTEVRSIKDAKALAKGGDIDAAISGLHALRRAHPKNSNISLAMGDLYFQKGWRSEGLAAYRDALAKSFRHRKNARLVKNTIESLGDSKTRDLAAEVIVEGIGPAAIPALRRASTSGPAGVRRPAHELLVKLSKQR